MKLSKGYDTEQADLQEEMTRLQEHIQQAEKQSVNVDRFLSIVKKYTNLTELTPEILHECYQVWWELQCQIEDFYSEKERQRPPLSEQKEFRPIKNAVIQEAENFRMGKVTFEDEEMEETTDSSNLSYDCWEL